ncbi:signal peptidase I [Nocardioides sp. YIM 152315]|uniref:signal peptidase I n=1 Tax=Nocardioides sp. YIM 152315 TaxID=3031760 RepID=UPI0023DC3220|nr:signal peptidase I [Nocardioides sp. YIM 152315]MDF1605016.1 signal peptidase I [Nocardioides sp. YIM 152315]
MTAHVLDLPVRADARHRSRTPIARRLANLLLSLVLAVGAVTFLGLAIGPHVLGYRTAVMLTGSMTGTIDPGDLVVSVPRPADQVEVGDILTFHAPTAEHQLETHRVIGVRHTAEGGVVVRTQGDANAAPDPWRATIEGDTVWETRHVVPHLGSVVRVVRATVVRYGAMWVALAGVVLLGLTLVWRQPAPRRAATGSGGTGRGLTLVVPESRR